MPERLPQSATIGTAFTNALGVTVKDAATIHIGCERNLYSPSSGASGGFSNSTDTITVATDASGVASAPFTANTTLGGPYNVTAAASGLTTVNFSMTNTGHELRHANDGQCRDSISASVHGNLTLPSRLRLAVSGQQRCAATLLLLRSLQCNTVQPPQVPVEHSAIPPTQITVATDASGHCIGDPALTMQTSGGAIHWRHWRLLVSATVSISVSNHGQSR